MFQALGLSAFSTRGRCPVALSVQTGCHIAAMEPHAEQYGVDVPADAPTQDLWSLASDDSRVPVHRLHLPRQDGLCSFEGSQVAGGRDPFPWRAAPLGRASATLLPVMPS